MGKTEKKLYILRGILSAIGKEYPESHMKVEDIIDIISIIADDDNVDPEELACTLFSKTCLR